MNLFAVQQSQGNSLLRLFQCYKAI